MMWKLVFVIAVVMLTIPGVSAAAPANQNKTHARKLYKQGKQHFQSRSYAAAVSAFKRSHALYPHRNTVYNIALSLAYQGDQVEAFRYLRLYLSKATPRDPPLDKILKPIRRAFCTLKVLVPDPQASIYVDGRRIGSGTLERILRAGTRTLEVRQGNIVTARKELDLPGGGSTVHWKLGALKVKAARPDDAIVLDGRLAGRGQLTLVVSSGKHVVEMRRGSLVVQRKELLVEPGETTVWELGKRISKPITDPVISKPRRKGLHWAWFTSLAAATVAVAVGATVMSFKTKEIWDEFKADKSDYSLADRGDTFQLTTNILWGVSGALALGTALVAVFTRWGKTKEKAQTAVTPLFGPSRVGAVLTWRH